MAIARDFAWIYSQSARITPGYRPIVAKLQNALVSRHKFRLSVSLLDPTKLYQAARDNLSEPARLTFAPQLGQLARSLTLPTRTRTTLHAYCLYAYLAGTSQTQILTDLAQGNSEAASPTERRRNRGDRLFFHKNRLKEFTLTHPGCTRSQLHAALPSSIEIVQREDQEWYERTMPESQSNKSRGRQFYRDWNDRATKLCGMTSHFVSTPGASPFRSFRDALVKLNQSRSLMRRERGRLPKFRALLQSLIAPKQAAA